MFSQNKHGLLCLVIVLCVCDVKAQIVSVQDGDWSSTTTWSGGIVPVYDNSSSVIIDHNVMVPSGYALYIDDVTVNGSLTIANNALVSITVGISPVDIFLSGTGSLNVYGTLICNNGAALTGTTGSNTVFFDGSTYRHLSVVEGVIPLATWQPESTFEILGFTGNLTMQSPNWGQTFGNLIYDCPGQGEFIEFKGLLRHVAGDFIVRNTNRFTFRLAQSQNLSLQVDGNVLIEGLSEIWFGMSGNNTVTIGGNFTYNSTSTASSYFTTTGRTTFTVNGNFLMNASWKMKLASSTASGHTDLIVMGDFQMEHGILDALNNNNNTAGGTGTIIFAGEQPQNVHIARTNGTGFDGNISFEIESGSVLNLGESLLSNTTSGSLLVKGKLSLASTNSTGMIQAGPDGNINVAGSLQFDPGSNLEFNGDGEQFISHTDLGYAEVLINNPYGVTLLTNIQCDNLTIVDGDLNTELYSVGIHKNVSLQNGTINGSGPLLMNGTTLQLISANGNIIHNVIVNKSAASDVQITSPMFITGLLSILSSNSNFISNGNLTLVSSSELAIGSGAIDVLPSGSSIVGIVNVQRYMAGIGDKYRYISSPVNGATVQSLKDAVPVTGIFSDPSSGAGIDSAAPSLFEYDERDAEWKPYPTSGVAAENYFQPGKGYCYFNWNGTASTLWNAGGALNQGDIPFSLTYTNNGDESLDGWNLVGNPYPCAIRWDNQAGWTKNLSISEGIAARDNAMGGFRYWDGEIATLPDGRIAPGQSFWVRTTGPDPQLTIHETAKVSGGAAFYRRKETLNYIELEVRIDDQSDKTFLRLRDGATDLLDNYDIPKLANDYLSLSFLTTDSISVAINAMEKMPCHLEIPLKISLDKRNRGKAGFSLKTFGLLAGSEFFLIHQGTNEKIKLDPHGSVIPLPETVANLDGLRLVIDSPTPEAVQFNSTAMVCGQDSLKIQVQNPQAGISYSVTGESGIVASVFKGENASLVIPGEELIAGSQIFQLVASSSCATRIMDEPIETEKIIITAPEVFSEPVCMGSSVTFVSEHPHPEVSCMWYESMEDILPSHSGFSFTTAPLSKSATYFVSGVDANGCESERIPVSAEVISYDSVTIALKEGILISSYTEGNQWFYQGEMLAGETNQMFTADEPGLYMVTVTVGSCTTQATINYVITGSDVEDDSKNIQVFPNPFGDRFFIRFRSEISVELFSVLSSNGTPVNYICSAGPDHESWEINTAHWPSGLYMLCFKIADDHSYIRIVKR